MNDPRENSIDIDKHAIWESDNREEARYQWNAMITDYCDMTPEEYMKNPVVEALKTAIKDASDSVNDNIDSSTSEIVNTMNSASTEIVDSINSASTRTNDNIDESTDDIISAITNIAEVIHSSTSLEIIFYYTSENSQIDYTTLTPDDFASSIVVIGSDTYINFLLGDPTPENWQKFLDNEIDEATLRQLSSNTYYIAIPKAYKGKLTIQENGTADVTDNYEEISQDIFDGYILYRSVDVDYFNEDYEEGITNVKQPHKITIAK